MSVGFFSDLDIQIQGLREIAGKRTTSDHDARFLRAFADYLVALFSGGNNNGTKTRGKIPVQSRTSSQKKHYNYNLGKKQRKYQRKV